MPDVLDSEIVRAELVARVPAHASDPGEDMATSQAKRRSAPVSVMRRGFNRTDPPKREPRWSPELQMSKALFEAF
jgi:hypothetical protein